MGMSGVSRPCITGPDEDLRYKLVQIPPRWSHVVDSSLRIAGSKHRGALPKLVFDPAAFIDDVKGRPVFRPAKDAVLLHLGHPVLKTALHNFARVRFPGGGELLGASRWTVREGQIAAGVDAEVLLTVEELGVNDLREPFHHWVRTLRFAVNDGELGEYLGDLVPADDSSQPAEARRDDASEIWADIELDIRTRLKEIAAARTEHVRTLLQGEREASLAREKDHFKNRIEEVREAMKKTSIDREIGKEEKRLRAELTRGYLFPEFARQTEQRLGELDQERQRRENDHRRLVKLLEEERDRILDHGAVTDVGPVALRAAPVHGGAVGAPVGPAPPPQGGGVVGPDWRGAGRPARPAPSGDR